MNVLLGVKDQINNHASGIVSCAFVRLTRDVANGIIDQMDCFSQARKIASPLVLWTVVAEASCRFLKADPQPQPLPRWLERMNGGYLVLPDGSDPVAENSTLNRLIIDGLDPHAIINEDGISWGLLVNDRPLGTATLPVALLEVAAGIKLPGGSFTFPTL